MCRPFWLRQSWWHAEQLLIRWQVWQSLSPLHQTGSTSSPKQSEGEGRGGGGGGGGGRQMVAAYERVGKAGAGGRLEGEWKWKARERRSAREGRGEETCRRISLGSGAGLFNERAHSTPPSSVAPAGWRAPGSGSAVGGSALFHHHRTRGGAEGGDLFSHTTCGATGTFAQTHAQTPKNNPRNIHSGSRSHTHTQPRGGEVYHMRSLPLFLFFCSCQRYNWLSLTHKHSGNNSGFPLEIEWQCAQLCKLLGKVTGQRALASS